MAKRVIQSKRRMMARRVCGSTLAAHCLSLPPSSIRSALIFFISLVCMKGTHTHRGYCATHTIFCESQIYKQSPRFHCVSLISRIWVQWACRGIYKYTLAACNLLTSTYMFLCTHSISCINTSLSPPTVH